MTIMTTLLFSLSLPLSLSLSLSHTHTHTYPNLTEVITNFGNVFDSHRSENFHLTNRLSNQHGMLAFVSNCPWAILDRLTDAFLYHDTHCSRWPSIVHSSCNENNLKLFLSSRTDRHTELSFFFCVIFTSFRFDHKRR
jgi:hypothetical protein